MSGNIARMFNQEEIASGELASGITDTQEEQPANRLNNNVELDDTNNDISQVAEEPADPFVLKDLTPELKDQLINSLKKNNIVNEDINLRPETPIKTANNTIVANQNQGAASSNFTDNLVDLKPTLPDRNHITDALESNLEMFTALGGIDRASSADSEATSLSSRQSSRIMRSFSNDDDASSQSSSVRSHQRQGSGSKNWVQFDDPQRSSRSHVPIQYTGSSIRSSDLTSEKSWVTDDRQSDFGETHETHSHDYIRLNSTKSPVPENWVTFEDNSQPVPSRPAKPESPIPSARDLGAKTPDTPTAVPTNWVAFEDDEKRSTILRSPIHQSLTGKSSGSQASRELTLTSTSEEGTPTRVLPERNIPSRGNPFAEELQKQKDSAFIEHALQNRPTSPYNPFIGGGGEVTSPLRKNWQTFDDTQPVKNPFNVKQTSQAHISQPYQRQLSNPITPDVPSGEVVQDYALSQKATGSKDNWENFIASQMGKPKLKKVGSDITAVTNTHQPFDQKPTILQQSRGASVSSATNRPVSTLEDPLGEEFIDTYPIPEVDFEAGWKLMLRHPGKKRLAGARTWKTVFVKITDGNIIQLFDSESSREPFSEIQLQSNYEISDPTLQSYDGMGKVHKVYLFYMSYVEKRKYSANAPFEKMKKADELLKIGSTSVDDLNSFVRCVNDSLMSLEVSRERGVQYHSECVILDVIDRFRALIGTEGVVEKQSTSVSISCIAFVSGMPDCAIGLNDFQRKDVEVTARQDIIPSKTERWLKMEAVEFHHCVDKEAFIDSHLIKFTPLEACKFELMRFKVKSHLEQTLPLMVRVQLGGEGHHLQLRADVIVRGSHERMSSSHCVCCDIVIRMPIPQSWVHIFRKKKRFGQTSVKSATKKSGKIKKGSNHPSLLETSVGVAKYEHAFGAIVWRIPKLPEKNHYGNSNHIFMCHLTMANSQYIPKTFQQKAHVDFTMPHSTASKTIIRSLSITNERAPEKRVRYSARYEYMVNIENHYLALGGETEDDPTGCSLQ
ncbi:stonin-2-like [Antedon mediterranea]|uniref:stonin-2-like n=1 Tax=Antedon mediterranea TaxID=105859 RepID=UPI003AF9ABFA